MKDPVGLVILLGGLLLIAATAALNIIRGGP